MYYYKQLVGVDVKNEELIEKYYIKSSAIQLKNKIKSCSWNYQLVEKRTKIIKGADETR